MKIMINSQRAVRTFIRVSLPSPTGARYSGEERRPEIGDLPLPRS
jgi:hypothetical protein